MNKQEFFSELEESLQGQVSDSEYRDSISYYRDYFREQEARGRSEQEILDELGSARYIAHSIIDAHGTDAGASHGGYYDSTAEYNDGYANDSSDRYQNYRQEYREEIVNDPEEGPVDLAVRKVARLAIVIVALLAMGLLIQVMLPFVLVIIAVLVIMNFFRRI